MQNLTKEYQLNALRSRYYQTVGQKGVYGVNIQNHKNVSKQELARLRAKYGI